jgi:hypothetical protein
MHEHRKEHSMVYLKGYMYVLGGYNPPSNQFLKTCERYDHMADRWEYVAEMGFQKCAFGCTTFNQQYLHKIGTSSPLVAMTEWPVST